MKRVVGAANSDIDFFHPCFSSSYVGAIADAHNLVQDDKENRRNVKSLCVQQMGEDSSTTHKRLRSLPQSKVWLSTFAVISRIDFQLNVTRDVRACMA